MIKCCILFTRCVADPRPLSQYVIALIKKDKPEKELKDICIDQLEVFLQDSTNGFVDDLFDALKTRSYTDQQSQKRDNHISSASDTNLSEDKVSSDSRASGRLQNTIKDKKHQSIEESGNHTRRKRSIDRNKSNSSTRSRSRSRSPLSSTRSAQRSPRNNRRNKEIEPHSNDSVSTHIRVDNTESKADSYRGRRQHIRKFPGVFWFMLLF